MSQPSGLVFNIMRFSLHDGPGIRTAVFLKGCPLGCWWCHNPESQEFAPSLMYFEDHCRRCGDCLAVCPNGAIALQDGAVRTSAACRRCGACVEACLAGARQLFGRPMTVPEVLAEVERDVCFFDESGGGMTLSGGEPLAQPAFAQALLEGCRERRVHTVLETCGFAQREVLLRVTASADLVLYDVKLFDPMRHQACTGVGNETILANLEALAGAGRQVVVRFPLVPGINDGHEELAALARFAARCGLRRIDVLPYHGIGKDKYRRLGLDYRLVGLEPPSGEDIRRVSRELESRGFAVRIGG